jgi:hypothetical protein
MPAPLTRDDTVAPSRGLALWLVLVAVVATGLVLAFRHGGAVTSLLGTRG